jgi:hypothetical protein
MARVFLGSLLAIALSITAASTCLAADRNQDVLDDASATSSTPVERSGAPIAVVNTGDGSVNDYVSRLTSLGHSVTTIPMTSGIATLSLYQLVILPVGHGSLATYANFDALSADYLLYVNSGGNLWVGQPNPFQMPGGQATITWVPYALTLSYLYNAGDCPPLVVDDSHCITQNAGGTNFSFPGDTVVSMGPEWQVLVVGPILPGNPSVFVATSGLGKVLVELGHPSTAALCSPADAALDRYATCLLTGPVPVEAASWAEMKGAYR